MEQSLRNTVKAVKDFISYKGNWIKVLALIILLSAVVIAFIRELKTRKERKVPNENIS